MKGVLGSGALASAAALGKLRGEPPAPAAAAKAPLIEEKSPPRECGRRAAGARRHALGRGSPGGERGDDMRSIAVVLLAGLLAACGGRQRRRRRSGGGDRLTDRGVVHAERDPSNASALNVAGTCDVDTGVGIVTSGFATALVGCRPRRTSAPTCSRAARRRTRPRSGSSWSGRTSAAASETHSGRVRIPCGTSPASRRSPERRAVYASSGRRRSGGPQSGRVRRGGRGDRAGRQRHDHVRERDARSRERCKA